MTHVDAFRLSVNPLSPLPMLARLHRLARPAGQGLLLAVLMLLLVQLQFLLLSLAIYIFPLLDQPSLFPAIYPL